MLGEKFGGAVEKFKRRISKERSKEGLRESVGQEEFKIQMDPEEGG